MSEPSFELEPGEAEIDRLLQRSMAAPVPRLPPDFDLVLSRELRRSSERPNRYGQILLASYGVISAVASIAVMRGQGLGWGVVAAMTLGPLALLEAARRLRRGSLLGRSAGRGLEAPE